MRALLVVLTSLLVLAALAALGVRAFLRHEALQRARTHTGVDWPAGSAVVAVDTDSSFHSDHTRVVLRLEPAAVPAFVAAHPALKPDGCRANAAAAFWGGPAPKGALCAEGVTQDASSSLDWQVTFEPATGRLVERVDAFW